MKFIAILHQFNAALKIKYTHRLLPSIYQAINTLLRCRTDTAGGVRNSTARTVMRPPFNPILVGIAVVLNVKTIKRHNGLTTNSQSICPSSILW